jgi:hypothetical protein
MAKWDLSGAGLGPRKGEEETFRAEAAKVDREIAEGLVEKLTFQNEALIANAFKTYKGNGNPNLPRFDMAMSAITAERNGRAVSDSLREDYLAQIEVLETTVRMCNTAWDQETAERKTAEARIAELQMELVTTKEIGLAFEKDAGQQRERFLELESAITSVLSTINSIPDTIPELVWTKPSECNFGHIYSGFYEIGHPDPRLFFKSRTMGDFDSVEQAVKAANRHKVENT